MVSNHDIKHQENTYNQFIHKAGKKFVSWAQIAQSYHSESSGHYRTGVWAKYCGHGENLSILNCFILTLNQPARVILCKGVR